MFENNFTNRKKDPLVEAAKAAMEVGQMRRAAIDAVNEEFGVYSRNAVVREHLAAYDARIEEAYKCMKEAEKADKDYDKDGKIESPKDEVWGSRLRAAKMAGKLKEEEQIDEKLTAKTPMGTYIKDFQKSDAPQFKGKSQEKRRVMAIAAKLSAERGGKPLKKEERLLANLGDLAENHKRTMLAVFDKLNEDNQRKFMAACETPEGIEQMLDFAINNRGE